MKKGWKTKTLDDTCEFLGRGVSPKYLTEGGICVLNQKCVRDHRVNYELSRRHDLETKKVRPERFVQMGDVLVNSTGTGTLGRVAQVRKTPKEPTTVDSHVTIVRPIPGEFYPEFFGYALVVIEEKIKKAGEGCGGQTELARSVLGQQFSVRYPDSLAEQERIVAFLDEAFAGIATAKAHAEKNLQNARALFESHLNAVFTQGSQSAAEGRGEGWVEKRLGDIATFRNGINFTKSSKGESVRIVGVKDFQQYFWAPDEGLDLITADRELPESDLLRQNDLLFVRSNGNIELIGRCVLLGEISERTTHSGFTIRARLNDASIAPRYLCHFLKSEKARKEMIEGGTGTNIKSLNQTILSSLIIPTPPPEVQQQIVEQVEFLSEESQCLESIYQRKVAALDELKQSILQQAFSGALTAKPDKALAEAGL